MFFDFPTANQALRSALHQTLLTYERQLFEIFNHCEGGLISELQKLEQEHIKITTMYEQIKQDKEKLAMMNKSIEKDKDKLIAENNQLRKLVARPSKTQQMTTLNQTNKTQTRNSIPTKNNKISAATTDCKNSESNPAKCTWFSMTSESDDEEGSSPHCRGKKKAEDEFLHKRCVAFMECAQEIVEASLNGSVSTTGQVTPSRPETPRFFNEFEEYLQFRTKTTTLTNAEGAVCASCDGPGSRPESQPILEKLENFVDFTEEAIFFSNTREAIPPTTEEILAI